MKIAKFKIENCSGITLIELIIYLGIMSVVLLLIVTLVSVTLRGQSQNKQNSQILQDMRQIADKISLDITNATSFSISNPSQLEITDKAGVQSIYKLSDADPKILELFKTGGAFEPLTSTGIKVTNLNFSEIKNATISTIQVQITLTSVQNNFTLSNQFSVLPRGR